MRLLLPVALMAALACDKGNTVIVGETVEPLGTVVSLYGDDSSFAAECRTSLGAVVAAAGLDSSRQHEAKRLHDAALSLRNSQRAEAASLLAKEDSIRRLIGVAMDSIERHLTSASPPPARDSVTIGLDGKFRFEVRRGDRVYIEVPLKRRWRGVPAFFAVRSQGDSARLIIPEDATPVGPCAVYMARRP